MAAAFLRRRLRLRTVGGLGTLKKHGVDLACWTKGGSAALALQEPAHQLTEAEAVKCLMHLDRLGIIELRALNRYRLKLAKAFRWRPHGPVMTFFRDHAHDYFSGGFEREDKLMLLVHGSINKELAPAFVERLQRVAQDFAKQHFTDQKPGAQHPSGHAPLGIRALP